MPVISWHIVAHAALERYDLAEMWLFQSPARKLPQRDGDGTSTQTGGVDMLYAVHCNADGPRRLQ
jgi:hypothetical protein